MVWPFRKAIPCSNLPWDCLWQKRVANVHYSVSERQPEDREPGDHSVHWGNVAILSALIGQRINAQKYWSTSRLRLYHSSLDFCVLHGKIFQILFYATVCSLKTFLSFWGVRTHENELPCRRPDFTESSLLWETWDGEHAERAHACAWAQVSVGGRVCSSVSTVSVADWVCDSECMQVYRVSGRCTWYQISVLIGKDSCSLRCAAGLRMGQFFFKYEMQLWRVELKLTPCPLHVMVVLRSCYNLTVTLQCLSALHCGSVSVRLWWLLFVLTHADGLFYVELQEYFLCAQPVFLLRTM